MSRRAVRRSALALAALAALAVGYGASRGLLPLPGATAVFRRLEGAPATRRPPAEFFSLDGAGRLAKAWEYVDRGEVGWALWAALDLRDAAGVPSDVAGEARFLAAIVYGRYLAKPWHAAAELRGFLASRPDGPCVLPARLLLAEVYVELGWVDRGVAILRDALQRAAGDPLVADAQALLQRLERRDAGGRGGGWARSLVPNNLRSLVVSFFGFAALLMPSLFKIGIRFHDGTDPEPGQFLPSVARAFRRAFRSRVYRLLFLGFVAALFLQYQLNRAAKAREQTQVQEALRVVRAAYGR